MARRVRGHREVIRTDTIEAMAAYFGDVLLDEFIYPFSRIENPQKLAWRRFQTRKHYRNYPKEIGRKYLEGLFRGHPITRQYKDLEFDLYLVKKYDPWFRRNVAMPALYLPELFVVGTIPATDGLLLASALEEDALGIRPYPVIVYPQHVRDFELDSDGNVLWITFEVGQTGGDGSVSCQVHTYTGEEFFQSEVTMLNDGSIACSIDESSRKPHGFARCPVVRIAYEDNAAYSGITSVTPLGHAMMKEIVSLSIADLQFRSMYIEACYSHLFYKIVMGEETAKNTITDGAGNNTVIIEEEEEKGMTRYMPTPAFEIDALRQTIFNEMPAQIYQEARLRDHSVAIAQSGLAKTFDMVPETGVLTAIAGFLSDADERIVDMLASAWMGKRYVPSSLIVTYPASFDVRTPLETMGQFTQFAGMALSSPLPTSRTAMREMVKEVQRAMLPSASAELLRTIDDETDVAPFAPTTDVPGEPGGPVPTGQNIDALHREQQVYDELRDERVFNNPNY